MALPFQNSRMRFSSVTVATIVASRFSSAAYCIKVDGHSHTLLALGDGQFGAVQTLIFLSDLVQVDLQAVGQLTDGNRDTACAKVVAALDEAAGILAAEQTLQLTLDGGVALLHLGTAGLQAGQLVGLGGAGGAADGRPAG